MPDTYERYLADLASTDGMPEAPESRAGPQTSTMAEPEEGTDATAAK